jgi:hypothetical protein
MEPFNGFLYLGGDQAGLTFGNTFVKLQQLYDNTTRIFYPQGI